MAIVTMGGVEDFNARIYQPKNPNTLRFLENQFEHLSNISNTLNDATRSFFSGAREVFDRVNGSEAMRLARAAKRAIGHVFQKNEIRVLRDIGALQQAPVAMQRWVLAEQTVRQMYHEQRCDGYSDSYVDVEPGRIGEDHYDWRQVMNGVVQDVVEEDGTDNYKVQVWVDDLIEGDRKLGFDEQAEILSTWDVVKYHLLRGKEDPTSVYNSKL